ncbi:MAG: hypothetical protein NTY02_15635 [Acidobacteria bacterium]|nr:hypothetical protein [Acidobacteriota bacterium]
MRTCSCWCRRQLRAVGVLVVVGVTAGSASGQARTAAGADRVLSGLVFRGIGPAVMGGRVSAIAGVETDPRTIYVGAATGGVWKTTDGGTTWAPIFDQGAVASIGDVAVAPSDPSILWVGTGEANSAGHGGWGDGVYKSSDAGRTWAHMGLADTHHIGRIVIDRTDVNHVFVAAYGHTWGPNKQRGLFETRDGGRTWTNRLFVSENTGVIDVAADPGDSRTLYAAAFERPGSVQAYDSSRTRLDPQRQFRAPREESESGIFRSEDGGASWQRVTAGLPQRIVGRIGLAVCQREPGLVLAIIEGPSGGVFRSTDKGRTWVKQAAINPGGAYFGQIRVDPTNGQRVWVLGPDPLFYSEDGGKTFCRSEDGTYNTYCTNWLERVHYDSHALWIDPRNADHMVLGGDGGIYISESRGRTWNYIQTLPISQFYQVGFDMQEPYLVYGGQQDTGTWSTPSRSLYTMGIANDDAFGVLVGDGYYVAVDPTDPDVVYAEYQGGRLFRISRRTWERRDITPFATPGEAPYRINSNQPLLLSPHNTRTLYMGGNRLFTSIDRGETWRVRDVLAAPGGGPGGSAAADGQITSIAESPLKAGILWIGTDTGHVKVSRDGGATWADTTPAEPGLPAGLDVSRVVASASGEGAAYVTFNGHLLNEFAPHIYRTTDYGEHWTSLGGGLPAGAVINVVREHPRSPNLLFLGTERGLFVSFDRGTHWQALRANLPPVKINDLAIHPRDNDLIVGTYGRGIYVLDDLAPLEQWSDEVASSPLHLFDIRPATMYRLFNQRTNMGVGHAYFIAPNPPAGSIISYYLESPPAGGLPVRITIEDRTGRVVRDMQGPSVAGLNRVSWDLRYTSPLRPPAGLVPDPPGQPGGPRMRMLTLSLGPLVLPGDYTVRVALGNVVASKTVRVREDPRLQISEAELREHRTAWHRLFWLYVDSNVMVQRVVELRRAVETWRNSLNTAVPAADALNSAGAALLTRIDQIQSKLAVRIDNRSVGVTGYVDPNTGMGGGLANRAGQILLSVGNYTGRPTPRHVEMIDEMQSEDAALRAQLNALIQGELPALNERARGAKLPEIGAVAPAPPPTVPETFSR